MIAYVILVVLVVVAIYFFIARPTVHDALVDKIMFKLKKRNDSYAKIAPEAITDRAILTYVEEGSYTNAFILIAILRKLNCHLPIFIAYNDLAGVHLTALSEIPGVTLLDFKCATELLPLYVLLFAPAKQVVFLRPDFVPMRNPEIYFNDSEYLTTGALYLKDRLVSKVYSDSSIINCVRKLIPYRKEDNRILDKQSGSYQSLDMFVFNKHSNAGTLERIWTLVRNWRDVNIPIKEMPWIAGEMANQGYSFFKPYPGLITETGQTTGNVIYSDSNWEIIGWVGGLAVSDFTEMCRFTENSQWENRIGKYALLDCDRVELPHHIVVQINEYLKVLKMTTDYLVQEKGIRP